MGMKRITRERAFTLVEIMVVVMVIAILMAIAIPNFIKSRQSGQRGTCIANLKQIDSAKEQWAMDNKAPAGAAVVMSDLTGTYIRTPATGPECPSGGSYTVNPIGTDPSCSYSTAPDLHILPY